MSVQDRWQLADDICFLNHGSFGARLASVSEAQREFRDRLEREPVSFFMREHYVLLDEARCALGEFVGADPRGLVFVPNATAGVNAVLRSLRFAPGDEILVTNHGYAACTNAASFATQRAGARLVIAGVPFPVRDEEEIVNAITAAATARTRLALIDHVTSPTALVFPIERLVRTLEGRGIPVMVDGAHAPGMLPVAIDALGASYYTGNCHKWMCNPVGAGFLHVRADLRDAIYPTIISHGLTAPTRERSRFHQLFDWPGTYDPTAALTVRSTLHIMGAQLRGGWDAIRRDNREKALRARECLTAGLSLEPCAPPGLLGSMASILVPRSLGGFPESDAPIAPLQEHLFAAHKIEVPVWMWDERHAIVRVSAHLYNHDSQYARLRDALAALRASS